MLYRKLKGSNIFDGYTLRGENKVLIIEESGIVEAIVDEKDAGEGITYFDGILCPGFINAHCHIELSHLKGKIPQHTGLVNFVQTVMQALKKSTTPLKLLHENFTTAERLL